MRKMILIGLLLALMLAACAPQSTATPYPAAVSWETAIEILHSGQVESAMQLHSLQVFLYLKDGQEVETTEPIIDAIFHEIDQCGQPCADILLATE